MPHFHFNPTTTRFSVANARRLAEASLLAYSRPRTIKRFVNHNWGLSSFRFIEKKDIQLFVTANEKALIVAFRGTDHNQFTDWITNINVRRVRHAWGSVHSGFKKALDRVWKPLSETMKEFRTSDQSLWFTGHSLGGALGVLAVSKLLHAGMDVNGLYTFGQPRVGDKRFAKKFNRQFRHRTFRFANNNDLVARVPPRFGGYRHIGRSFYFDRKGKLHKDPRSWKKYLDRFVGKTKYAVKRYAMLQLLIFDDVDDHDMQEYIDNLKKVRES